MKRRSRAFSVGVMSLALLPQIVATGAGAGAPAPSARPRVYAADVEAIIHPVSAEFIVQTIDRADAAGAVLVVFTLRTPGGLVDSTMKITSRMLAARTPVVVFIGPSGARAASAGFLITIAADVAAMAPGTHFGAAHPVAAGGEQISETMSKKAAQDVAAYARSLATQRHRNVELAEKAVTESRAFTAEEALNATPPLIDLIATDLDDLLRKLDGRKIRRLDGSTVVLATKDAQVERVAMSWRQRVLSAIAHPQIALLLFSLGTLGLTIELWNPGAILPGVVGGLCLLLAFFAFQILPVNYVGLLLIAFGLLLLVLELKVTSFGLLAVGGLLSMIFGAMILVDSPVPELRVGLPFAVSMMLALGTIVLFLTRLAIQAQLRRPTTGTAGMIGQSGVALTAIAPGQAGQVRTFGEIWRAVSDEPIQPGDPVRVVAVDGLTVKVQRIGRGPEGGQA